jgi:hypothetical protein
MSYLGRQPISGNYQVLDAIVATTTDTYALTKDTVAVFPQTPSNCIVSLNGVIQAPVRFLHYIRFKHCICFCLNWYGFYRFYYSIRRCTKYWNTN